MGRLPKLASVDRVYKGRKEILGVEMKIPGSGKDHMVYEKNRDRARFK
jgi:plastocyanin domain-containing protein